MADEKKTTTQAKQTAKPVPKDTPSEPKVLVSKYDETLPGQGRNPQVRMTASKENLACLELLYVLFEGNFISRTNLREMIEILNKPRPQEGVAQYLINEAWLA